MTTRQFLIVTPTLNAADFIDDCLAAVASSFAGFDYEHVVVDGGSNDETTARVHQSQHRATLIHAPGTSMYEALTLGIAKSEQAEVFYQINADDLPTPQAGQIAWDSFMADPSLDVLTGGCVTVDLRIGMARPKIPLVNQLATHRIGVNLFVSQPSSFVRVRSLEKVGGYDTGFRFAADTDLWLRLSAAGCKWKAIDHILSIDRLHAGSARLSQTHLDELAFIRARTPVPARRARSVLNALAYGSKQLAWALRAPRVMTAGVTVGGGPLRRVLALVLGWPHISVTIRVPPFEARLQLAGRLARRKSPVPAVPTDGDFP